MNTTVYVALAVAAAADVAFAVGTVAAAFAVGAVAVVFAADADSATA